MTTFKDKVSLQIEQQLPEFVRAESPNFIAFMKAYYEFMESAELKLTTLGSVDSILLEAQPVDASSINYVLLQDTNRYRPGELDTILLEAYDVVGDPVARTVGAFVNGETITGSTSKATAIIRTADVNENSRLFISAQSSFIIGETVTGSTSNATGVISVGGSALTSDQRYKKNITPVTGALEKLSKLNPVNYDWRRDEFKERGFSDRKQWGFIAQEVEKVMPELVHEDMNGYQSLNYVGVIPLLTKAMQEQQTEMEKQQKEIDELKAQLEMIMKMMQSDMSDKTDNKKAENNEKPVKLSMATVK